MALFGVQHLSVSPVLHLDFSNDAGNTAVAGDFSDVVDLSGNGYHATQATAGSRPQKIVGGQNGLSFARFGPTDVLDLPSVPQASGQIVVMIGDLSQTGTGTRALMTPDTGGLDSGITLLIGHSLDDNKIAFEWDGASGLARNANTEKRKTVLQWQAYSDATKIYYRNQVDNISSGTTNTTISGTTLYTTWKHIGKRPGGDDTGLDLYELLILPDTITSEELRKLKAGLVYKWGIEGVYNFGNPPLDDWSVGPPLYNPTPGSSLSDVSVTDTTATAMQVELTSNFAYPGYVTFAAFVWADTSTPGVDPPAAWVQVGNLSGPGTYTLDFTGQTLTAGTGYILMVEESNYGPPTQSFGTSGAPIPFTATADAPAATPLTVGGMSQGQQQGASVVSPAASVQPAGVTQAQSISDLGLAHTYAVTPSVMRQAHSIEKAATYAASWIVAGNIRQIQRMTGVELTARYPVTAHDARQGQALNIANLESNYMLAIQTLLQAQGQYEIAIDPNYPLTVAAISQAQRIKAPSSLTANGVLALNHMTQEQTEALVEAGGAIISFEGGHIVVRRKLGRRSISAWHLH